MFGTMHYLGIVAQEKCPTNFEQFVSSFNTNMAYLLMSDSEIEIDGEDLKGILTQVFTAELENVNSVKTTSFASTYSNAYTVFSSRIGDRNSQHETVLVKDSESFKLFTVQTFLYLISMQLHQTNIKTANEFLHHFLDKSHTIDLVRTLCTNEGAFKRQLQTLGVNDERYKILLDATNEIVLSHVAAPHFDELRTLVTATRPNDTTNYLVIGGSLCWSAAAITELGNISSKAQQSEQLDNNFAIFYQKMDTSIGYAIEFESLNNLIANQCELELFKTKLQTTLSALSAEQLGALLLSAIDAHPAAAVWLHQQGAKHRDAFTRADDRLDRNNSIVKELLFRLLDGKELMTTIRYCTDNDRVRRYLSIKPSLIEFRDNESLTPILLASQRGNYYLVKELLSMGAQITSGTFTTGRLDIDVLLSAITYKDLLHYKVLDLIHRQQVIKNELVKTSDVNIKRLQDALSGDVVWEALCGLSSNFTIAEQLLVTACRLDSEILYNVLNKNHLITQTIRRMEGRTPIDSTIPAIKEWTTKWHVQNNIRAAQALTSDRESKLERLLKHSWINNTFDEQSTSIQNTIENHRRDLQHDLQQFDTG